MSTTVSVAKMATAFKSNDGTVGFALFEQTFEKNCSSHSPKWGCRAIGTREDVLMAIFLSAACFEDGLLQSRSGERSTEGYISAWLDEIAMPFDMPNKDIVIRIGKDLDAMLFANDCYGNEIRPKAVAALRGAGFDEAAATLDSGQALTVNLYKDLALLRALFALPEGATEPVCPQWRVLNHKDAGLTLARTLGVPKAKIQTKSSLSIPQIRKLQSPNRSVDTVLIQQHEGHYAISWYSYVNKAIASICAEAEISRPGSYDANIKALRAAVRSASPVDDQTKVELSHEWIPVEAMGWMAADLNRLAAEFGAKPYTAFTTTWGDILTKDIASRGALAWDLARLSCSRWHPTASTDLFSAQNDALAVEAA